MDLKIAAEQRSVQPCTPIPTTQSAEIRPTGVVANILDDRLQTMLEAPDENARLAQLEQKVGSLESVASLQSDQISEIRVLVDEMAVSSQSDLLSAQVKIDAMESSYAALESEIAHIKEVMSSSVANIRAALLRLEAARLRREEGKFAEEAEQLKKFLSRLDFLEKMETI